MSETALFCSDRPLGSFRTVSAHLRCTSLGWALVAAGWFTMAAPVAAQDVESIPGVTLSMVYERYVPPLAIMPFSGTLGGEGVASQVHAIIGRDLRYSDRFSVVDSLPAGLQDEGVDYGLWDQFGADWLLTGSVEGSGNGSVLILQLHDVVFASVKESGRFRLPDSSDQDFRMAVHRVSDQVVEWIFGEPGMAASQIAFVMRPYGDAEPMKELYVVDSDGENLRRLTYDQGSVVSPAWAPDGRRLAYASWRSGIPTIYERTLATGQESALDPNRTGQQITPAYHPDGSQLAFALLAGDRSGLFSYNLDQKCCLSHLSGGRHKDLQPTFSHDGRYIAFTSNRLGTAAPQVYVMSSQGGEADMLSPYRFGEGGHFTDPDWSPTSGKVAFSGRIQGRGIRYHILVADMASGDSRLMQLTREGSNEDPSWAPDGRHIVFTGERSWGHGIFIVDTVTGTLRTLVSSVEAEDTDWSPALGGGLSMEAGGSSGQLR